MKNFFNNINKKKENLIIFLLFSFASYCALTIGSSWDEDFHLNQGKVILDYLFSFGNIDTELDVDHRKNYSAIYWSISYLITKIFPLKYELQISHMVNLLFSLSTIFGLSKISKEFFNKKVAKLSFLILFFYPVFFGHMAMNPKDTILAFSHIWISYLIIRYLKHQNNSQKKQKYIFLIGILSAIGTGIQMVFIGSLLPIIIFVILDINYLKIFSTSKFNFKKFFLDLIKCFLIFYSILILFWVDAHDNIIIFPFKYLFGTLSSDYWTGWSYNLLNGEYYYSDQIPKIYLFINFFFKSPEYLLLTYVVFSYIIFKKQKFFKQKFKEFNKKIFFILSIILFPNIVLLLLPYPIYDGMRLFLWAIPYLCIIPGLTIYYFIENYKNFNSKFFITIFLILFSFLLFNFIQLTPYQYTYLNLFAGKNEYKYKKFENDYWGTSTAELIKNSSFKDKEKMNFAICGMNDDLVKKLFKQKGYYGIKIVDPDMANYIIMTNRATELRKNTNKSKKNLTNCFNKYKGKDIFTVKRQGLVLSSIRKINNF